MVWKYQIIYNNFLELIVLNSISSRIDKYEKQNRSLAKPTIYCDKMVFVCEVELLNKSRGGFFEMDTTLAKYKTKISRIYLTNPKCTISYYKTSIEIMMIYSFGGDNLTGVS